MADTHNHGRSACQRSVGRERASRGGGAACLALAIAGTFCALASVAGSAGQDYCGLWGGPLVRPGVWSGDEAQRGLITTPLIHRHRVPAVFLEPQQLLGTPWPTRFSSAADAFTHQTERLFLVSCPSGHIHHLRREPADKMEPYRGAPHCSDLREERPQWLRAGQAIGRELETNCFVLSLAVSRVPSPSLTYGVHLPSWASPTASISSHQGIARLVVVSSPFLSFVFVTGETVAAGASHVFHLSTRAHGCGHRGRNFTPEGPSQHNRLRGAAVSCLGACVAMSMRYIGPCCHVHGYSALLSLHHASSACFSCVQHRQTPGSVNPYQCVGGLDLASEARHWHKRLSSWFSSR